MNLKAIFAVMNITLGSSGIGREKNSGKYVILTYDLCDTGATLFQMS